MTDKFFLDLRNPDKANDHIRSVLVAMHEEGDLLCALIMAAYVDKCLVGILKSVFVNDGATAKNQMNSDTGIINSLASRAQFAYMLGHIPQEVLGRIEVICKIRNLFAHSEQPLSFTSPEVVKWCNKLPEDRSDFKAIMTDIVFPQTKAPAIAPAREKFVYATFGVILGLAVVPTIMAHKNKTEKTKTESDE